MNLLNHYVVKSMERRQKWKAEDKPAKQQAFICYLIMLENLQGSKDLLPNAHYAQAATNLGYLLKLW